MVTFDGEREAGRKKKKGAFMGNGGFSNDKG